ncbi:MAG: NAD-dependent epimerase/dehydratase family protein [Deltaproteobacteria bacterium]|nr:NAD-dependent epimerase/dehydratase family protein [Deltaproteobacteria bacterium]
MPAKAKPDTLITGATGFLGRHLTEYMVQSGATALRALTHNPPPPWLEALGIECIQGSVLDASALKRALDGIAFVYHLAGRVSRNPDNTRQMHAVHVDGTRALFAEAIAAQVKRIVLASSSGTIAVSESADDRPDESFAAPIEIISRWPYYASKAYQEQTATALAKQPGAPELVTLNPSLLLGPGDERLSSTNDVLRFLRSDIPVVPSGGINFVDARDVAPAFVAAMERGKPGERYLLGGPNWTFREFFGRLERISKVRAPKIAPPDKLVTFGARLLDRVYRHRGKLPPIDAASVEMATYFWYLDDSKARAELGFENRDFGETLFDTVDYLRKHFINAA